MVGRVNPISIKLFKKISMASVLIIHSRLHLSEHAEFCAVGAFRKASVTQNGGFCRADSPVGDLERGSPCLRLQPLSTA